jgi:CheY-like chemotaxis protein
MISVLFVDDNTELFRQIRSFLEKAGDIRIDTAHSIKQAIEKIKGRTYDVIISYEQIPEVNGIEFMSDMNGIKLLLRKSPSELRSAYPKAGISARISRKWSR